jgi:maleate cis-trans isomerase
MQRDVRLGVVVPSSNTNLEPDVVSLLPPGVTAHFTRIGLYDVDAIPDVEEMRRFSSEELDLALAMLTAAGVGAIAYGCTGATLWNGPAFDRELEARLTAAAGVPAITAAGALVEALQALGARRVALATPYAQEMMEKAAEFLELSGFEVLRAVNLGRSLSSREQRALAPAVALELGRESDHAEADALVLSCTDLRALEIVDTLERELAKPVVTSNQALVWVALGRLVVDASRVRGFGRLFAAPAAEAAARSL